MSWNLPGAPWLIAHKSMLKVNRPQMVTINRQDYVIWKNQVGKISALENKCPHMGAKLSQGWICPKTNTIACPYHALEFDSEGRAVLPNEKISQAIAKPLKLFVQGDFIWTYANEEPKIPIPDILNILSLKSHFVGVAGEFSVKADILSALEVNHDYNHQKGAHRELFRIKDIKVDEFRANRYTSAVDFRFIREKNTLIEYLKNPLLLVYPQPVKGTIENYFPAFVIFNGQSPFGKFYQVHAIYPETETTTKTFVLVFREFSLGILNPIIDWQLLSGVKEMARQDVVVLENLYPRGESKIRLPNEEPLNWVRKLYYELHSKEK